MAQTKKRTAKVQTEEAKSEIEQAAITPTKRILVEYKAKRTQGEIPLVTYETHRNAFIGIK